MQKILLCLLSLTLSGCGSAIVASSSPKSSQPNKIQLVAADLSQRVPVTDLTPAAISFKDASKKFTISRRDPVYNFAEGRAYFRTVALPPDAAGKMLEIRSYYSLDFPTTLFVPALLFIDSSQQVLETRPLPPYKIVNTLGEHIRLMESIPTNAAYVVIYTTPSRVSERMVFQTYSMTAVSPTPSFASKDSGFGGFYEGILRLALVNE